MALRAIMAFYMQRRSWTDWRLREVERPRRRGKWYSSRLFLVPKAGSRPYRTVIDLRTLNNFCPPGTCEVETLHILPNTIQPDDHLVSIDLSDGFFHLAILPEHGAFTVRTTCGMRIAESLSGPPTRSEEQLLVHLPELRDVQGLTAVAGLESGPAQILANGGGLVACQQVLNRRHGRGRAARGCASARVDANAMDLGTFLKGNHVGDALALVSEPLREAFEKALKEYDRVEKR